MVGRGRGGMLNCVALDTLPELWKSPHPFTQLLSPWFKGGRVKFPLHDSHKNPHDKWTLPWEVQTMHDYRKLSADTTIHLMGSVSYSISSRDLCFFVTLPGSLGGGKIGPAPRYGLPSPPKEEESIPLP